MNRLLAALLVAAAACAAHSAHAGQVRVSTTGFSFDPRAVNCNLGDQVCWVLTVNGATVTSGDSATGTPDGLFESGSLGSGGSFSWQTDRTGHVLYYSQPFVPSMAGRIIVSTSGIDVADFRLTEIQYNVPGGQDLIEIANLGAAAGDLGRFRLSIPGMTTQTLPPLSIPVPSGGRVVVHLNASGTNTATDVYLPGAAGLPDTGSVALYTPNSAFIIGLGGPGRLADFVQWGDAGQLNEDVAATAAQWTAGQYMPGVAAGHSLEFCGGPADRGMSHWAEVAVPNFGTNGMCVTPTRPTSWGRLKTLYR